MVAGEDCTSRRAASGVRYIRVVEVKGKANGGSTGVATPRGRRGHPSWPRVNYHQPLPRPGLNLRESEDVNGVSEIRGFPLLTPRAPPPVLRAPATLVLPCRPCRLSAVRRERRALLYLGPSPSTSAILFWTKSFASDRLRTSDRARVPIHNGN